MKLRLLLSISLAALAVQKVCAESADDFFHSGAQSYLSNNVEGAKQEVAKGLKLFPDDTKLKKLDELLKQQQQQQQQQNQQQQNSKQNQSQSKQDQQKQSEQQKQDEQKKQQEQQQQQKNQQRDQEKQGDEQKQKPKEQQTAPAQMTPEEAKQLLDSQKGDEMLLPANHQDKHDREHPLKDWYRHGVPFVRFRTQITSRKRLTGRTPVP
jgi:hypothetical protein